MKLLELTISNFQSIGEPVCFVFDQVSFLIGPNSVGKSSIFDALDLVKALAEGDFARVSAIAIAGTRSDQDAPISIKFTVEYETHDCALMRQRMHESIGFDDIPPDLGGVAGKAATDLVRSYWLSSQSGLFAEGVSTRLTFEVAVSLEDDDVDLFRISRNDELLFEYDRNASILLNPYLEEIKNDDHAVVHQMIPKILLRERWYISRVVFDGATFGIGEHMKRLLSTARGRAIIKNDEFGIWIHGITCRTPEKSTERLHAEITLNGAQFAKQSLIDYLTSNILNSVEKAHETYFTNFKLPESLNVEDWVLSAAEVDQAIALLILEGYREGIDDWTESSLGKLVQDNILLNYRLQGEALSSEKFTEFLNYEYRTEGAGSRVRADLEIFPTFLNAYLCVAQELMTRATVLHHVRGDRTGPSSQTYYHVAPHRQDARGGTWFYVPEIVRGSRQLISQGDPTRARPHSRSLDHLALSIARSSKANGYEVDEPNRHIIDRINAFVEVCMPSIARFKFRAETYIIRRTTEDDASASANSFDGHFLISFHVEDTRAGGLRRSFDEVGSGLGYVLPILAALVDGEQIISVEQPELHLHPQAQSELMTAIIRSGRQVIIETHSERFIYELSALLRKQSQIPNEDGGKVVVLNQTKIDADSISINYIDIPAHKASPVLQATQIRFSKDGRLIDDWPRGFNWMAVSPAFQQIGVFEQDEQLAQELRSLPWLAALADLSEDMAKWTISARVAQSRQDWDATVIYVAKVLEELLDIKLKRRLVEAFSEFSDIDQFAVARGDPAWPLFMTLKGMPNERLTLGTWKHVLVKSQASIPDNRKIIRAIRELLGLVDWAKAWRDNSEHFLKELDKLHYCRNRAAHVGKIGKGAATRLLALVIDVECGNDAGLALRAFGVDEPKFSFRDSRWVSIVASRPSGIEP